MESFLILCTELHSNLASIFEADIQKVDIKKVAENDLVFLALPHKTAMGFVKELMKFPHLKIVDLSADYRLTQKVYEENYLEHIDSENLKNSVYGLPELYREEIKKTRLVANPGCFPTSTILGILPFLSKLSVELNCISLYSCGFVSFNVITGVGK